MLPIKKLKGLEARGTELSKAFKKRKLYSTSYNVAPECTSTVGDESGYNPAFAYSSITRRQCVTDCTFGLMDIAEIRVLNA